MDKINNLNEILLERKIKDFKDIFKTLLKYNLVNDIQVYLPSGNNYISIKNGDNYGLIKITKNGKYSIYYVEDNNLKLDNTTNKVKDYNIIDPIPYFNYGLIDELTKQDVVIDDIVHNKFKNFRDFIVLVNQMSYLMKRNDKIY